LLRPCRQRPRRRRATEQGEEIAPSHELPSNEAQNLAHHWTMRALCIAAKYSRLCRFRVKSSVPSEKRHVSFDRQRTFSPRWRNIADNSHAA
jgi:hypothetical protein